MNGSVFQIMRVYKNDMSQEYKNLAFARNTPEKYRTSVYRVLPEHSLPRLSTRTADSKLQRTSNTRMKQ